MEKNDFEHKTEAFLAWLSEVGASINPNMALFPRGSGRGVVAVADLDEDELVFSIPRTAVLNVKTAMVSSNTSSSALKHDAVLGIPSWLSLTTVLISESQRTDSKWAPYFAVLPQTLDSLVFWSESEISELQASSVVDKIGKASAEESFTQHIAPLGFENCNYDLCHRVASTIMAYAFDIPEERPTGARNVDASDVNSEDGGEDLVSDDEEDERTILSMVPLADMLNADAHKNNARLVCEGEDLEMRTIKPIAKGEEIFNDYGQLPRADLLRRYGYVTENYATYDVAELSTKFIASAFGIGGSLQNSGLRNLQPLGKGDLQRRVELAEREDVYDESYDLSHKGPDGPSIPYELLALLYLLLVDSVTLEEISSSSRSLPNRSTMATELIGQVLVTLLRGREAEYQTTLEEDEQLLQVGQLSTRTEMAVQVRLGEKTVLREAIQEAASFAGSNERMRFTQSSLRDSITPGRKARRSTYDTPIPKKKGRFK